MPFATSLKTKDENVNFEPGINLKWGVSSDLTVDMTLNPDYSQIEADAPQIDINRRFALYYPEKRPFFLEGMEHFQMMLDPVYTRTIADPRWGLKMTGKEGSNALGAFVVQGLSSFLPSDTEWFEVIYALIVLAVLALMHAQPEPYQPEVKNGQNQHKQLQPPAPTVG